MATARTMSCDSRVDTISRFLAVLDDGDVMMTTASFCKKAVMVDPAYIFTAATRIASSVAMSHIEALAEAAPRVSSAVDLSRQVVQEALHNLCALRIGATRVLIYYSFLTLGAFTTCVSNSSTTLTLRERRTACPACHQSLRRLGAVMAIKY